MSVVIRRTGWMGCLVLVGAGVALINQVSAQETSRPPMPPMTVDLNVISYPAAAQKAGVQGRVLVEFTITKRGKVDSEIVVVADPEGQFETAALAVVKKIKFAVPPDWGDTNGVAERYRLSVLFKLNPCPPDICTAPKAHPEADDFIVVGARGPH